MKALIIGSTAATGKEFVPALLVDPRYIQVVADFLNLEAVAHAIRGVVRFSCLGIMKKIAGYEEKHWQIDCDIPAQFAAIACRHGVPRAVVLSSYGAAATSRVFYTRMKGALDDHIASPGFRPPSSSAPASYCAPARTAPVSASSPPACASSMASASSNASASCPPACSHRSSPTSP